ncbi:hypothetical protein BKG82_27035 [Mycobacteroides chelonae]|uniref:Uncharacterized protein n=1 Tax=Mycobacteroides chelonae TaxID=1774 RepID=A0A1S1LHN9_MYCCH|nr:hypothetical protein [Mycobacteroides chelonae]OHU47309.1 hypothetical protein BKG82_27035 [Mycobacteroides chelonae]
MTDLATFQRALDLYGAAAYWRYRTAEQAGEGSQTALAAASLADELRDQTVRFGASDEQVDDAEQYARTCILKGRKPSKASWSFEDFQRDYDKL